MESKRVVHVIDDEETIRKAVGFTLRTAGFAVETYGSGVDFLKIADEAERGSIVLDMHMPDMNGLQVQAALTQMDISMPVMMLTGNGDIALAVQAMKAGAVDFLAKPIERALLLDAIDRAFARIDTAEGRALEEAEACRQVDLLTPRERDVLEGLAQGLPNKTIAYDLGISSRTVEVHRASIMSKLGVRTLSETLRIAFAAGMGRPL
jgi:two-component system response regulator FixJ